MQVVAISSIHVANPVGGAFNNIALYSIQIALALSAGTVDYVGRNAGRRDIAARLGANVIEDPTHVERASYPVTVDASMNLDMLRLAIEATAPSGTCTVSTMYTADTVPLPLFGMFQNCITLRTGQLHVRTLMEPVPALVADGRVRPDLVTTDVVGWDSAVHAFGAHSGSRCACGDAGDQVAATSCPNERSMQSA